MSAIYTVWVGGVEVNDYAINCKNDAEKLATEYSEQGYDDVAIVKLKGSNDMDELETFNVYFALFSGKTLTVQLTGTWANIQRDIQNYILENDIDVVDFDFETE
jgi:hypothetical protein